MILPFSFKQFVRLEGSFFEKDDLKVDLTLVSKQ